MRRRRNGRAAMFKRMFGGATPAACRLRQPAPHGDARRRDGRSIEPAALPDSPRIQVPAQHAGRQAFAPMAPTPSGYVPGAPIIVTRSLHEGLTRLQAGQTGFDVGGAHGRRSRASRKGCTTSCATCRTRRWAQRANQLESMTIEMVAMLFDFIFETRDLPDGIKALLARLQIPVLKAAMLDGAFFAKKSHPSRLLVNALAQAGSGWSPVMGQDDPLYRKIDGIVHGSSTASPTTSRSSTQLREDLEDVPGGRREGRRSEHPADGRGDQPEATAQQIAAAVAQVPRSNAGSRSYPLPEFPRELPARALGAHARARLPAATARTAKSWGSGGRPRSRTSSGACSRRRPTEDRKHLVALLPSLLKRLSRGHARGAMGAGANAKCSWRTWSRRTRPR